MPRCDGPPRKVDCVPCATDTAAKRQSATMTPKDFMRANIASRRRAELSAIGQDRICAKSQRHLQRGRRNGWTVDCRDWIPRSADCKFGIASKFRDASVAPCTVFFTHAQDDRTNNSLLRDACSPHQHVKSGWHAESCADVVCVVAGMELHAGAGPDEPDLR